MKGVTFQYFFCTEKAIQILINKGLCNEWHWISDWMYYSRPCHISC
jgi:hypothetical protein